MPNVKLRGWLPGNSALFAKRGKLCCLNFSVTIRCMAIGERIKAARELAGMSREELAAALGVSLKSIANWETGRTQPQNKVAVIERILRVDLSARSTAIASPTLAEATDAQITTELVNRLAQLRSQAAHNAQVKEPFEGTRGTAGSGGSGSGTTNTQAANTAAQYDPTQPDFDLAADRGPKAAKRRNEQWDSEILAGDPDGPELGA